MLDESMLCWRTKLGEAEREGRDGDEGEKKRSRSTARRPTRIQVRDELGLALTLGGRCKARVVGYTTTDGALAGRSCLPDVEIEGSSGSIEHK